MLLSTLALMLLLGRRVGARSSPISDLKSKISGVEELLEQFRKQLQQEQSHKLSGGPDACVGGFGSVRDSIIQTKASIEQGATFLLAPERVYTWRDCLHACCSQPHCTVAVVQEEQGQPGESLNCYLFNCTYRSRRVCSFAPQPGFSAYSRDSNTSLGRLPAGPAAPGQAKGGAQADEEDAQGQTARTKSTQC